MRASLLVLVLASLGCYTARSANHDVNQVWVGRSQGTLEAHWGPPAATSDAQGQRQLRYSFHRSRTTLPSGGGHLIVEEGYVDVGLELRPGTITRYRRDVLIRLDPAGRILSMTGPSIRWGPPDDANMRWGFLLGGHAGMGRLDDTSSPLPGGGLYVGGMLSPTLGLVGTFSLASGSDDDGGAMAFAWGLAPQLWVATRVWLRAGPAMILAFDPGFENAGLEPGVTTGASFAVIRSGTFVLDLRADVSVGTDTQFGTLGIGVNLN